MIFFLLANSVDLNEMSHSVAFHQGLHCLPNYAFIDFLWGKSMSVLVLTSVSVNSSFVISGRLLDCKSKLKLIKNQHI